MEDITSQILDITSQIMRPGTFAMAVAVFIATFFTRRVVELLVPLLKHPKDAAKYSSKLSLWWNGVILYAIPVVFGGLFSLSKSVWLFGEIDTFGSKMMFGAGVGWFASFLYKIFRKLILQKTGVELPGDSEPSEAAEPTEDPKE